MSRPLEPARAGECANHFGLCAETGHKPKWFALWRAGAPLDQLFFDVLAVQRR